tara:strand:+ start:1758 stop:2174 length:417 start_codon:yes stop_codon:yes gene_type:complete
MPLYLTERISDFETIYNPDAVFVYFDSIKGDSTSLEALKIRELNRNRSIGIIHRKSMSAKGAWTEEEFKDKGVIFLNKGFDVIRADLIKNRLIIFPVRAFAIVRDSAEKWVTDAFNKKYKEIVNTNPEDRDLFDYYAI